MSRWKNYSKKAKQPMRPYVGGENMSRISVPRGVEPKKGGMIAVNPMDVDDQWYVSEEYFKANYDG